MNAADVAVAVDDVRMLGQCSEDAGEPVAFLVDRVAGHQVVGVLDVIRQH